MSIIDQTILILRVKEKQDRASHLQNMGECEIALDLYQDSLSMLETMKKDSWVLESLIHSYMGIISILLEREDSFQIVDKFFEKFLLVGKEYFLMERGNESVVSKYVDIVSLYVNFLNEKGDKGKKESYEERVKDLFSDPLFFEKKKNLCRKVLKTLKDTKNKKGKPS